MRICLIVVLFVFNAAVQASSTLRVGNQVLTAGDSQERVTELLGKPSSKSHRHASHKRGGSKKSSSGKSSGAKKGGRKSSSRKSTDKRKSRS